MKTLLLLVYPGLGSGANYRLGLIRGALKLLQSLQHVSPDAVYLLLEAGVLCAWASLGTRELSVGDL